MVKKKYKSKRISLHKKYKIERKVREHKRTERKKERMNQHKKKKDPGIPNNWPFKEELLLQVEQARLAEVASKQQAQALAKEAKKERKRAEAMQRKQNAVPAITPLSVEMQAKKDLKDAVKRADLVLLVLDARDPQGCRALSLEDGLIAKAGKKVALVLNKVDLISPDTAAKWLSYLRRFHPTIAVRALNQKVRETKKKSRVLQGQRAMYDRAQELTDLRDNGFVDPLRAFLDAFARDARAHGVEAEGTSPSTSNGHARLTVALVGYPNVGKSTLLNSLKKRALATVATMPNTTKTVLEVQYNETLTLVDTPALDPDYSDEASIVMRHSIAGGWLEDPVPTVKNLLLRGEGMNLMQHLQLPVFKDHEDFLAKLAIKKNLIRKGGDPDLLQMARMFLRDLGNGTYSTSCLPPAKSKSRFELPKWFTKLNLDKVNELEASLFASNATGFKRAITFAATPVAHVPGDTTEYDLVFGLLPENDGLTSDEEEDDEDMEGEEEMEDNDDEDAEE